MDFQLTDEQRAIRDMYRSFAQKELTPEYVRWLDENTTFLPDDMYQKLAELGTMGIGIPEEYGGLGLGSIEHCLIMEELSTAGISVGFCAGIAEVFGGRPILALGTEAQKREHLPRIVEGKEKWSLAMTEPDGGTDILGAIRTSAVKTEDHYVVKGTKMWISGAHVADFLTTLVITDKDTERKKGLSVLIIDAKAPGVTIRPIEKMGVHGCGVNEIVFEDVEVPVENLLGEENRGWYGLLKVLNPERISTSVFSLAIARSAFDMALRYAKERTAFGKTIGSFQILQHYLADIAVEIENARNLIYKCAWLHDTGQPYDVEACMAKIVACRASELAARYGMEIMGGYGFAMEYDMQRHFRDYKQMMFSPISDEMAKNYIAQSYGLPPELLMATGGTVQVDVAELGAKLESIVGPGRVSTSRAVCRAYSYSAFWGRTWLTVPDLVVVAATAEEVSQVLRVANEAGVPATPKGPVGQGGFGGPMKGGILLDLTPMDEITVDRKNMKVIAGAGGSFFRLAQELFKHRLMLPTSEYGPGPTVASSAIFPVNAFGKTRYGRNIDLVEGFEVVLPDGQIVRVGSMAYADSDFGPYYRYITGPDLVGLFTQSNGAFGIVTKVAYSCLRLPKCWAFHAYYWPLAQAETFAAVMTEATAMEIFDIHISDRWRFVGLEKAGLIPPLPNDCNFVAYLTVNAESPAELAAKEDVIHEMCRSRGGTYLPGAADHFYAEWPTVFAVVSQPMLVKLFNLTREASGATGMMICDSLNYPTSWFPQVYDKLMKTARKYGLWGEPNMIVYDGFPMKSLTICSQTWLFIDFYDRDWMRRVEAYRAEFREWFGARGGTHQSGVPPYPEYSWGNQPGAHDLLRRIKGLLDPNDILSPGTFEKRDWSR